MEAPLRTVAGVWSAGVTFFAAHGGGDLGSSDITSDVFKSLNHGDVN